MSKQSLFQPDAKYSDLAQHAGKVRAALFRHSPMEQMAEFKRRYSPDFGLDSGQWPSQIRTDY